MSTPRTRRTRRDDHSTDGEHTDLQSGAQTRSRAASSGASEDERGRDAPESASDIEQPLTGLFDTDAPDEAEARSGEEDDAIEEEADNLEAVVPGVAAENDDDGAQGDTPDGDPNMRAAPAANPPIAEEREAEVAHHRAAVATVRRQPTRQVARRRVKIASPHRAAPRPPAARVERGRRVIYDDEYSDDEPEPEVHVARPRVTRVVRRERHEAGAAGEHVHVRVKPTERDGVVYMRGPRPLRPDQVKLRRQNAVRLAAAGDGRHVGDEEYEYEDVEEEEEEFVAPRRPHIQTARRVADIKLPTFDGDGWLAFRHQFEAACRANGYTEGQRCSRLKCVLRGAASAVLGTVGAQQWSYRQLLGALEARYGRVKSENDVSNEMFAKCKGAHQTAHAFADELIALANQAEVLPEVAESMTYLAFKNGLRTAPAMQSWVSRKHTKSTLRNCVEWAAIYERERGREVATTSAAPWPHLDARTVSRGDASTDMVYLSENEPSTVAAAVVTTTKPVIGGKIETILEKITTKLDDVAQQQVKLRDQYEADKKNRSFNRSNNNSNRGNGNFGTSGRGRGVQNNFQRRNGNFGRRGGYQGNYQGNYSGRGNRGGDNYSSGNSDGNQQARDTRAPDNYSHSENSSNSLGAQDGRQNSQA